MSERDFAYDLTNQKIIFVLSHSKIMNAQQLRTLRNGLSVSSNSQINTSLFIS